MTELPPQRSEPGANESSARPTPNTYSSDPVAVPVAPPLNAIAVPVNFCSTCGAAWQLDWLACAECAARVSAGLTPDQIQREKTGQSVGSAIGLYFAFLVSVILCGIIPAIVIEDEVKAEVVADFAGDIVGALVVLIWVFASWRNVRGPLSVIGPPKWYFAAVTMGSVSFVLATLAVNGLQSIFGIEEVNYSDSLISAGFGWGVVVLLIAVQPAIFEELAFRGVIFGALRCVLDNREVILVSSLMFMVIHLSVPSFPHLLIIGLALGYLRSKTGSLYPCMLMHFTHNALVIAAEAYGYK